MEHKEFTTGYTALDGSHINGPISDEIAPLLLPEAGMGIYRILRDQGCSPEHAALCVWHRMIGDRDRANAILAQYGMGSEKE